MAILMVHNGSQLFLKELDDHLFLYPVNRREPLKSSVNRRFLHSLC